MLLNQIKDYLVHYVASPERLIEVIENGSVKIGVSEEVGRYLWRCLLSVFVGVLIFKFSDFVK